MCDEYYMNLAYQEAMKAKQYDEVPIGAIIIKDDKIIASTYNQKEMNQDVTAHAEILAIRQACYKLGSWHLDDCTLYVTLEPCMMCSGAIIQSRMKKVVFGAKVQRWDGLTHYLKAHDFNHIPEVVPGLLEEKCSLLIKEYFKQKRNHY